MSTVERNLKVLRHGLVGRKMSQTRPGTLLPQADPRHRSAVGRQGGPRLPRDRPCLPQRRVRRRYRPLHAVRGHLCTGWTERIRLMSRGQAGIVAAIHHIREQLPFALLGIHPDSGSEFINWQLLAYSLTPLPQERQTPTLNRRAGPWSVASSATSALTPPSSRPGSTASTPSCCALRQLAFSPS